MPRKAVQKSEENEPSPVAPKSKVKAGSAKTTAESKKAPAKKAPAKVEPKAKAPKKASAKTKVSEATEEPVEPTENSTVRAPRVIPTRETVEQEFLELIASVDEEIGKLKDSATKTKGVKFLRSVNKRLKVLKTHSLRVSKTKNTTRRNNTNSGFLKPVRISEELAEFTGWDHNELRSRVDVTKFICNYVKENDLQNPEDKRQIRVNEDPKLLKLLAYTGADGKPLTYYSLQTHLKPHFIKEVVPGTTPVASLPVETKPKARAKKPEDRVKATPTKPTPASTKPKTRSVKA